MVDLAGTGGSWGSTTPAGRGDGSGRVPPPRPVPQFWRQGLALENVGDIDVQTVAGATATGTHGTGLAFGNLSSTIVALRVIDGTGEVVG